MEKTSLKQDALLAAHYLAIDQVLQLIIDKIPNDSKFKVFSSTQLGKGLISFGVGVVADLAPQVNNEYAKKLAHALRLYGLTIIESAVLKQLVAPLKKLVNSIE